MFGWLRSRPTCPIDAATREWVDRRWAWLESEFGVKRLRGRPVILPRPEFFPDPYHGEEADVRQMLDRVCGYMDIDPATVEMVLYEDRNPVRDTELTRRGFPRCRGRQSAKTFEHAPDARLPAARSPERSFRPRDRVHGIGQSGCDGETDHGSSCDRNRIASLNADRTSSRSSLDHALPSSSRARANRASA